MVAIKDRESRRSDVARVIETGEGDQHPTDQQVLHVLTQEFIVRRPGGYREPIGMSGVRLEVRRSYRDGRGQCGRRTSSMRAPLWPRGAGPDPAAAGVVALGASRQMRRNSAVALVDVGGGTSDIAIFTGGAIRHTAIIPIAATRSTNGHPRWRCARRFRTPRRSRCAGA